VVAAEGVPQPLRSASLVVAFCLQEEPVDAGAEEARRAEAEVVREPGGGGVLPVRVVRMMDELF
jgi:hypothetical protein